jgi:hypothetical protein
LIAIRRTWDGVFKGTSKVVFRVKRNANREPWLLLDAALATRTRQLTALKVTGGDAREGPAVKNIKSTFRSSLSAKNLANGFRR